MSIFHEKIQILEKKFVKFYNVLQVKKNEPESEFKKRNQCGQ